MSFRSDSMAKPAPSPRSFAIAALLGATMLATPLTAARADSTPAQAAAPQSHVGAAATGAKVGMGMKGETVEQRITNLHTALKITPDEEANWTSVAQAMRDNAAATEKLAAERTAQAPQNMTALDDLKTYEKFAQAHVDGLKNLTSSFETLYKSMPDPQKKVADRVFQSSHHHGDMAHG